MHFPTAFFIYQRRALIARAKQSLAYVDSVIKQENALHEHELVVFLHDCYAKAVNKSLKLKQGESGVRKISKRWKDYEKYVKLIPLITENKINPFSFFSFVVEQRRNKKIPVTIANAATKTSINHYLSYIKSNSYKVATYSNYKDYEETLYNSLNIDLVSLTTYLLRKPRVALSSADCWLFSSFSKVLIAMNSNQIVDLDNHEQIFYEDLMFDSPFFERIKSKWNQLLDLQVSRVKAMEHELRDANFLEKLKEIARLLAALKI